MEQVFQGLIDRTRARLHVERLKTIFGAKARPHRDRKGKGARLEVRVGTPAYDLTIFKLHFGKLTLKAYTKGEHVLRFEAIVHNTKELRCGRRLERFPQIIARLQQILEQFLNNLYCMDASFVSDETLDQLPTPSQVGQSRVSGIDMNKPRMRAVLQAALSYPEAARKRTDPQNPRFPPLHHSSASYPHHRGPGDPSRKSPPPYPGRRRQTQVRPQAHQLDLPRRSLAHRTVSQSVTGNR